MAKNVSIIRYKYKADRDFESVQFEGPSCPLGELKRLIIEKSTRSGGHHSRDDYDLIISDSTTHEEYKDPMDMIKKNTSVVVTRRVRGMFESLTPSTTTRKPAISSDEIVNKYLRPVIGSSATAEMKPVPLEAFNQPPSNNNNNNNSSEDFNEEERLKQVLKSSQPAYMPVAHRSNTSYICHTCKQPGHLRSQCPLHLQSSSLSSSTNSTGHVNGSSSVNNDGTQSTSSSSLPKPTSYNSHIITNQAPYHYGHRTRHPRHTDLVKRPTGIPRNGLIRVPAPLPGVLTDKSGQAFVPKQMAELLIENSDKKGGVPSAPSILLAKSADEELPPDDLLCPICKKIYFDAVITPCCHNSFCDDCIRNALIESEIHECPQCHRQNVPINHINPNLILRKHVNQWQEERQQKSSLYYPLSQTNELNTDSMGTKLANNQNFNEPDEYDAAILPTVTQQQPVVPIKNAPIVIKMKPIGRSPSPSSQQSFETKSADMIASEDDKTSDNDIFNQKEKHIINNNNSSNEESSSDKLTDSNISENEKFDRHTPPSQVAPVSTILSSPPTTTTTTMATSSSVSVVPHYYPVHPHMSTHGQHIHPDMMYPTQHPLPTSYSMPPNYYPPVMHVSYPGGPSVLPMGGMTHYSGHSAYPPMHSHLNNYHIQHYEPGNVPSLHHQNPSGSTLIPHANQPMMKPTLTEDEFYSKQRSLQRTKRSTSRRRSRSSSRSSSTSNNSRTSSFSRRNDRYRRRSSRSRSRSRQRVERRRRDDHRPASPVRQQRRRSPPRHRSPADRNRTRTRPSSKDNYRRTSPVRAAAAPPPPPPPSQKSTRDRERRRSPRPPPTALQSIQRTIVYSHDSSSSKTHSNRDNRRSRSRSRHRSRPKDDRTAPSSKTDHHSQSESRKSNSPITVPSSQRRVTLSSIITPVIEENSSKKTSTSIDTNNERKRKKTSHQHPPSKYRRYQSAHRNSRDRQNHRDDVADDDDDDDDANIVVENTTTDSRRVIEAQ